MNFNDHSRLEGSHALLAPSKPAWLNYSDEQLIDALRRQKASQVGTVLHELADKMITQRIKLLKRDKNLILLYLLDNGIPSYAIDIPKVMDTMIPYIADCISHGMHTEKVLYYSDSCYGTVDAISYHPKTKTLRIFDLKTGVTPARAEQLEIYAGLYFLEYMYDEEPEVVELRVYQNGEIITHFPEIQRIRDISEWIRVASEVIDEYEFERG